MRSHSGFLRRPLSLEEKLELHLRTNAQTIAFDTVNTHYATDFGVFTDGSPRRIAYFDATASISDLKFHHSDTSPPRPELIFEVVIRGARGLALA